MSLVDLTRTQDVSVGFVPYQGKTPSFWDVATSAFDMTRENYNLNSSSYMVGQELKSRDDKYFELTGEAITSLSLGNRQAAKSSQAKQRIIDEKILALRDEDERFREVATFQEAQEAARSKAKKSSEEFDEQVAFAEGPVRWFGALAGGLAASVYDPFSWAGLAFAPLYSGAKIATGAAVARNTLLRTATTEFAVGAGFDLAASPFVADWQKQVGNEYGLSEIATNMLVAGAFGSAASTIPLGLRNASRAFYKASQNANLPLPVRNSFEFLGHFSREKENNKLTGINPEARHADNTQAAVESLTSELRAPRIDELDVRALDFIEELGVDPITVNGVKSADRYVLDVMYPRIASDLDFDAQNKLSPEQVNNLELEIKRLKAQMSQVKDDPDQKQRINEMVSRAEKEMVRHEKAVEAETMSAKLKEKVDINRLPKNDTTKRIIAARDSIQKTISNPLPEPSTSQRSSTARFLEQQDVMPQDLKQNLESIDQAIKISDLDDELLEQELAGLPDSFKVINDDGSTQSLGAIRKEFELAQNEIKAMQVCGRGAE